MKLSLTSLRAAIGRSLMRGLSFPNAEQMLADRLGVRNGRTLVTGDAAKRHSAVWACLRLRGDLVSTMPVDAYRKIAGIDVEVSKPPMLVSPGGERVDIHEWLYSSQNDLDGYGNTFGLITATNALGLPARIDLQPIGEVTVSIRNGELAKYRICNKDYNPSEVWHEKQFTVSGLHVGLSPIAYGALSISTGISAQEFAANWFGNGAMPTAILKNEAKTLNAGEARLVKTRFKAAIDGNDIFVTGKDWDYKMMSVPANQTQFIEMMEYSVVDIARFFGCPADLIEAAVSGQSVTYANISQRNLQFLIMNLGPALIRRETALSRWLPRPQHVKFNSDALLRMDPATRGQLIKTSIDARTMTNSEARALENKPPLTPEQIDEFATIYGPPKAAPAPAGAQT